MAGGAWWHSPGFAFARSMVRRNNMYNLRHIRHASVAALAATLLWVAPAASAVQPIQGDDGGNPSYDIVGDLLALAQIEGTTGLEGQVAADVQSPSALVATGRGMLDGLSAVQTPVEAFSAATGYAPGEPGAVSSLALEVLGLYSRMGALPSLQQVRELVTDSQSLDPATADAIARLVSAVNDAIDASLAGDRPQAAADLLAAIEDAKASLTPGAQAASHCTGPNIIFQDPLNTFVTIRGTCNHT